MTLHPDLTQTEGERAHVFRLACVWLAVDLRFNWFRAVLSARNHRFAARTGYGCDCGTPYERAMRFERRDAPCPNRKWHRESARSYLRDARLFRGQMRREDRRPWDCSGVRLETQAEWMVQGGPPWLCLGEPERVAA